MRIDRKSFKDKIIARTYRKGLQTGENAKKKKKKKKKKKSSRRAPVVSHSDDGTRDRSESVGRHDSRGRPRNVNNRSRSRSVKPRDKSTTGAAKAQQNKQNDKLNSSSCSEPISTQNKV